VLTTLKRSLKNKTKKEALTYLALKPLDLAYAVMRDRIIYNFSKSIFTKQYDSVINTAVAL